MTKVTPLPASIKSLCGKVALERNRRAQWDDGAQLRRKASGMLTSGQSDSAVLAWLQALLGDALTAQARGQGVGGQNP